jgi:hypothetical protein
MNIKFNRVFTMVIVLLIVIISCEKKEIISGFEGVVYRGPINPVAMEGQINDAPFSALFHVYNESDIFVKSFNSNNNGEFSISLSSGTYFVIPDKSAPILRPELQIKEITLISGEILSNDFYFDTGIR